MHHFAIRHIISLPKPPQLYTFDTLNRYFLIDFCHQIFLMHIICIVYGLKVCLSLKVRCVCVCVLSCGSTCNSITGSQLRTSVIHFIFIQITLGPLNIQMTKCFVPFFSCILMTNAIFNTNWNPFVINSKSNFRLRLFARHQRHVLYKTHSFNTITTNKQTNEKILTKWISHECNIVSFSWKCQYHNKKGHFIP